MADIDDNLLNAVIHTESGGDPFAVSKTGAAGLTQLEPATAKELGVTNRFDPEQAKEGGRKYLSQLVAKYGDTRTALIAYNWGPGNVDKHGVAAAPAESKTYADKVLSKAGKPAAPAKASQSIDDFLDGPATAKPTAAPQKAAPKQSIDDFLGEAPEKPKAAPSKATAKPEEPSFAQKLGRQAGLAGRAILSGLAEAPNTIANYLVNGSADYANKEVQAFGTPEAKAAMAKYRRENPPVDFNENLQKSATALGLPEPANRPERVAQAAMKGLAGAALPLGAAALTRPAGAVAQGVRGALTAAPGYQLAGAATSGAAQQQAAESGAGKTGQMLAGVAGAVLPGVASGAANGVRALAKSASGQSRAAGKLLDAMESDGWTHKEIAQAQKVMEDAATTGIPLTGPEAFKRAPKLQELLAKTDQSNSVISRFVRDRPEQAAAAIKEKLQGVGKDVGLKDAANNTQAAADAAIREAQAYRTRAASPYYEAQAAQDDAALAAHAARKPAAPILGPDGHPLATATTAPRDPEVYKRVTSLINDLDAKVASANPNTPTGAVLGQFRDKLKSVGAENFTATQLQDVYRSKKELLEHSILDSNLTVGGEQISKKSAAGILAPYMSKLDQLVQDISPSLKEGRAVHRQVSQEVVDPLLKGPVGALAGSGVDAQKEAVVGRALAELKGPSATPDRIRKVFGELGKVDKAAAPDLVRAHLEDELSTSLSTKPGSNPALAGAKLADAIAGTPKKQAVLNAALEETYKAQGADPKTAREAVRGFNNLLEVLRATGRGAALGGRAGADSTTALEAAKTGAGALVGSHYKSAATLVDAAKSLINKSVYKNLAATFTDPDSVAKLVQLAGTKAANRELRNRMVADILNGSLVAANRAANKKTTPPPQEQENP